MIHIVRKRIADNARRKGERDKLRNGYLNAGSAGERLRVRARIVQYNRTAEGRMRLSVPTLERMREADRREGLR